MRYSLKLWLAEALVLGLLFAITIMGLAVARNLALWMLR